MKLGWLEGCAGAAILFASVTLACNRSREPMKVNTELRVSVRTVLGEPVSGARVIVGKEVLESDLQGQTSASVPPGSAMTLSAECPSDYSGSPLTRNLSASLLASGARLSFELLCEPIHVDFAVAVLSECDSVDVFVDGMRLGTTEQGLLHALLPVPEREYVEISAISRDAQCLLKEPSTMVELDRRAPAAWVLFAGTVRQRAHGKTKVESAPRPYQL